MSLVRYRGFELLTVYEEDMEGPYIAVRGSHEYMIKPGSSGSGNLRRIDNLLGSLRERFKKESMEISRLEDRRKELHMLLITDDDQSEKIEALEKELKEMDR